MKVICIDARRKPEDFPPHLWLVEQIEVYTVVKALKTLTPGVVSYVLKERDLSGLTKYSGFDYRRFRPATKEDLKNIEEAQKLLEELNIETLV